MADDDGVFRSHAPHEVTLAEGSHLAVSSTGSAGQGDPKVLTTEEAFAPLDDPPRIGVAGGGHPAEEASVLSRGVESAPGGRTSAATDGSVVVPNGVPHLVLGLSAELLARAHAIHARTLELRALVASKPPIAKEAGSDVD